MFDSRREGGDFNEPAKLRTWDDGGDDVVGTKYVEQDLQRGGRSDFALDHSDQLQWRRGVEQLLRKRPTRSMRPLPRRANAESWGHVRKDRRVGSAIRKATGSGSDWHLSLDRAIQRYCWNPRDEIPTHDDGFTPIDHRHTGRQRTKYLSARGYSSLYPANGSGNLHMDRAELFQRSGARALSRFIGKHCNGYLCGQVDGSRSRDRHR